MIDVDLLEAYGWHAAAQRERLDRPLPGTVRSFLYYAMLDATDSGRPDLSDQLRDEWKAQGGR